METKSEYADQPFERVILVHGTGAAAPTVEGTAWWQMSAKLWRDLSTDASAKFVVEAFRWSGENSEDDRRQAGVVLAERLMEIYAEGGKVHLIGHSHGGSVIWHALNALYLPNNDYSTLVMSWATVGTPFLKYGVRRSRLIISGFSLLASLACLTLLAWSARGVEFEYAWNTERLSTGAWALLCLIPIGIGILSAKTIWPYFKYCFAGEPTPEWLLDRDFAVRYLSVWSSQDEPTIGLAASGSFDIDFFAQENQGRSIWALARHPLFKAVNQFVNNLISRKVQGSTIEHLELRAADNFPHPELMQHALAVEIDVQLIAAANSNAAVLGSRLREILIAGRSPLSGFMGLKKAAEKTFTFNELVHTTYFENQSCITLLENHIRYFSHSYASEASIKIKSSLYGDRFIKASEVQPVEDNPPPQLPANQLGFFVLMSVVLCASLLLLVQSTQSSLHKVALAPTTPMYQLERVSDPKILAAMLSLVTERPFEQAFAIRSYIEDLIAADQLESFIAAANKLPDEHLRQVFKFAALPLIHFYATSPLDPKLVEAPPEGAGTTALINAGFEKVFASQLRFTGADSVLERFPRFAKMTKEDGAAALHLFLAKAHEEVCDGKAEFRPYDAAQFGLALSAIGDVDETGPLVEWRDSIYVYNKIPEGISQFCPKLIDEKSKEHAFLTLRAMTFVLADWINGSNRKLAKKMMFNLRSLQTQAFIKVLDLHNSEIEFSQWYLKHGYYDEAFGVGVGGIEADYIRSAALLRLASCDVRFHHLDRAKHLIELGEKIQTSNRAFRSSAESLDVLIAEALLKFGKADWRGGMDVCSECDLPTKAKFRTALIRPLSEAYSPNTRYKSSDIGYCPKDDEISGLLKATNIEKKQFW